MATIDDVYDKILSIEQDITILKRRDQVKQKCTTCGGIGTLVKYEDDQPGVPISYTCPLCLGMKYLTFGKLDSED